MNINLQLIKIFLKNSIVILTLLFAFAISTTTVFAATVGVSLVGSLSAIGTNILGASKIIMPNVDGNISSMSVYFSSHAAAPSNKYYVGIYSDNNGIPGTLLVSSMVQSVTTNGWKTIPLSTTLKANNIYWLAVVTNGTSRLNYKFAPANSTYSMPITFGTLPNSFTPGIGSPYLLSVYATYSAVAVPDTIAPTVSISKPVDGIVVRSTTSISAEALDNVKVIGVQFVLDGENLSSEDTVSPYSVSWNASMTNEGIHTLAAIARDASGNHTTSLPVSITVDTTAPIISAGAPSGTLNINTDSVALSFTTDENATCKYSATAGVSYTRMTNSFTLNGSTAHSEIVSNLTAGNHTYYVKCRDDIGNTNTNDYIISFNIPQALDTTSPVISEVAQNSSETTATVTWKTNEQSDGLINYGKTTDYGFSSALSTFATSHTVSLTGLTPDTTYHFQLVSKDRAGNEVASGDFIFTTSSTSSTPFQIHLGIMGDSASDEFRADDNRGGSYATTTYNWLELLVRNRGIDAGKWGTRQSPRRTGYEYNWALSGDTASDIIAQGQHTGIAAQVTAGKINTVMLYVGANDFAIWNGTYAAIYDGTLSSQGVQQKVQDILSNITTAIDTVQAAGPENMIVVNYGDRGISPDFITEFPDTTKRQRVTNAILAVNSGIQNIVAARQHIALFDLYNLGTTMLSRVDANGNLIIGGEAISLIADGNEPHHVLLGDHEHAGTVMSGAILANNLFIDTYNRAFGGNLIPFSDQEALTNAGIISN